jgi:hypothetical protein
MNRYSTDSHGRLTSLNVESCKAGHIEDYAPRTAVNTWHSLEAQEQERQAKRGRDGPGMSR